MGRMVSTISSARRIRPAISPPYSSVRWLRTGEKNWFSRKPCAPCGSMPSNPASAQISAARRYCASSVWMSSGERSAGAVVWPRRNGKTWIAASAPPAWMASTSGRKLTPLSSSPKRTELVASTITRLTPPAARRPYHSQASGVVRPRLTTIGGMTIRLRRVLFFTCKGVNSGAMLSAIALHLSMHDSTVETLHATSLRLRPPGASLPHAADDDPVDGVSLLAAATRRWW